MNNTTFRNLLKKLAPEFGNISEAFDMSSLGIKNSDDSEANSKNRNDIEKSVLSQIDKSAKLDEVDTVTFGLETDDNKIVKVYVNAEQAADFEKELAQKLGEVDDIEEVLNELSKKFDIIDVEWPDENTEEAETEEEDGSASMDPRVYKKNKNFDPESKEKGMNPGGETLGMAENLSYGERASMSLVENMSSIEQRLTTPSQLLVYHAILQLGIPETALTKSPYRSSIIQGIKNMGIQLNNNSPLKLALKNFVKYAVDMDDTDKGDSKKEDRTPPVDKKENKHEQNQKDTDGKEVVKEDLNSGVEFWGGVKSILKHVMTNETSFERLVNSPAWNRLVARSEARIGSTFVGTIPRKMADLVKQLPASRKAEQVDESLSVVELENLLNSIFEFADPTPDKKYAANLLNSLQMRQFITSVKTSLSQKFPSAARTRMDMLINLLTAKTQKSATTPVAEAINPSANSNKEDAEWKFESTDKGLNISHGYHLNITLDAENTEHMAKGISAKRAVVAKDIDGKKFTFSPRGVLLQVKPSGTTEVCEMSAKDVEKLIEVVIDSEKKKNN
jgi:hypothetical protein